MRWAVVAVVVLALANVALAADEQQKAEASPKWIQGESKSWPKWGEFRLRWLKAERRESVRDRNDAQRELTVVKSWGRTYVRNRVSELVTKTSNRVTECKHFKSLWQIRNANYKFHKDAHSHRRRRHGKRKPWQRKSKKPKNKNTSKGYYFRKFSLHARMLIASRDRLAAARRASARCWGVVKKLRARRPNVEKSARATARNAVVRAKAHLQRTEAQVKAVDAKIARQLRRIRARLAKYKTYYFHRCSRVKGHKYRCLYSIRHGGGDHSRRPFKFFKCLWSSSNEVVVRHVCYK